MTKAGIGGVREESKARANRSRESEETLRLEWTTLGPLVRGVELPRPAQWTQTGPGDPIAVAHPQGTTVPVVHPLVVDLALDRVVVRALAHLEDRVLSSEVKAPRVATMGGETPLLDVAHAVPLVVHDSMEVEKGHHTVGERVTSEGPPPLVAPPLVEGPPLLVEGPPPLVEGPPPLVAKGTPAVTPLHAGIESQWEKVKATTGMHADLQGAALLVDLAAVAHRAEMARVTLEIAET